MKDRYETFDLGGGPVTEVTPTGPRTASGRNRSGDYHAESANGVISQVSDVRLGGVSYNVEVIATADGKEQALSITPVGDPIHSRLLTEEAMSDALKAQVCEAISSSGRAGTRLNYNEAQEILTTALAGSSGPRTR